MKITCTAKEQEKLLRQLNMSDCDYCILEHKCLDDDKYKSCYDTFVGEIEWIIIS